MGYMAVGLLLLIFVGQLLKPRRWVKPLSFLGGVGRADLLCCILPESASAGTYPGVLLGPMLMSP